VSELIPWEEARDRVLAGVVPLSPREILLEDALGLAAAQSVIAPACMPPFDNSAVDGFAVRASDLEAITPTRPLRLRVVGERPAGASTALRVDPGQACRIMTGAPIPEGADAVVMIGNTDAGGAPRGMPGSHRGDSHARTPRERPAKGRERGGGRGPPRAGSGGASGRAGTSDLGGRAVDPRPSAPPRRRAVHRRRARGPRRRAGARADPGFQPARAPGRAPAPWVPHPGPGARPRRRKRPRRGRPPGPERISSHQRERGDPISPTGSSLAWGR
jgi:hypothetical protein